MSLRGPAFAALVVGSGEGALSGDVLWGTRGKPGLLLGGTARGPRTFFAEGLTVTEAEKAAAFDALADALINNWIDDRGGGGTWSWWCPHPSGGPRRTTKAEAIATLVEWAQSFGPKWAAKNEKLEAQRTPLPLPRAVAPPAEEEFAAEQKRRGR